MSAPMAVLPVFGLILWAILNQATATVTVNCLSVPSTPNPRENVLGRSEYASESGPGGPPCSLWRTKKRSIRPRFWVQKKASVKPAFFCTQKDTSFRTRLIEELDVLCRLAARFKHYYEKPALTEDAF